MDEQLLGDGVCVVEWADKAAELFPADSCWIELDYGLGESCRSLTITAAPKLEVVSRYEPLLGRLHEAFLLNSEATSATDAEGGE